MSNKLELPKPYEYFSNDMVQDCFYFKAFNINYNILCTKGGNRLVPTSKEGQELFKSYFGDYSLEISPITYEKLELYGIAIIIQREEI